MIAQMLIKDQPKVFEPYFAIDILADTPKFYIISGIKK